LSGPKCGFCTRPLSAAEWKRRVEYRWSGGGVVRTYGPGMEAGPVTEARGTLVQVLHYKCHYAAQTREKLEAARADSGEQPTEPPDWREQESVEVGELVPGEGDGNP
jgi:hypothetical protein